MTKQDIFRKVRKIEIKTRGLSQQIFSGQYHSAFKGRGMAFSEVREYQYGDDVRSIDWNVTARFNHPFVKVFEEERELTVMLLIDVSGSQEFGSKTQLKKMLTAELAAVLAFSAIQNNDKVGVIFFSNTVEKFIPPKKGTSHILRIIREIISFDPIHRMTDIAEGLRFLTSAIKKRSTAFLISDFINQGFEQPMRIAARKHDLIALRITDKRESTLPPMGLVKFEDAESGKEMWIDTSHKDVQQHYRQWIQKETEQLNILFTKSGVDNVHIYTDEDYVRPLMKLFKMRADK
ncbi:MAG: DUF58 domain-containing protein [Bacteroidales bacterium]|nr:DUF58 domain-containing protein [Bacteroidales bacterium]MDD3700557.1 DUF58 domain-containing protein [Bacteroidales bacterium]MDY0368319.1 DUF58 domain-containing protein [Bacteroidales bacterium]